MAPNGPAIVAEGLRKEYRQTRALEGFDLTVPEGSVCGLLGPNGAGKTTAVRILSTLLEFDGGRAEVAGFDVVRQAAQVRYRIGVTGQHAAVDEILTGRQNLEMFGRLYHLGAAGARRRADELLERFGLAGTAGKSVKHYSGGMRRRLDLAASLIMAPQVLFLDEPTTGLDPRGRIEVWEAVRSLVAEGTTVLLTTQYLDEADRLADRIVVLDKGRMIAEGSPDRLKSTIGGDQLDLVITDAAELDRAARVVAGVCGAEPETRPDTRGITAPVRHRAATLAATTLVEAVRALDEAGIAVEDIALRRPTLDEVFLRLTGHPAGPGEEAGPGGGRPDSGKRRAEPAGHRAEEETTAV
ncbi:ATP-binding cassette domain-containing protein [Planomonospora venezuelensis]|uniref:ABC-2 type transport system ATP-binding protein n=1 Tax=Planomonospora venezuelensis TaxID=1999 RepID=A0A841DBL3_PLAVE|nr:ATP-binding cassette domain-containing protein [Planomonospora venezuelensis]MBB5966879.1 ABC-2 type transport system ATP-binding protein [Planomonospora venezuelensis]GIN02380.1 daunorubicin resistance protein DrrA family ABC transporter ATP-binding protein [Planomonospora venezuelensis]